MKPRDLSKNHFGFSRLFKLTLMTLFLALLFIGSTRMQSKIPYDKERLLKVVKLNALSTQEITQAIEKRGVSFQMNPTIEAEFEQAGARPELIDAIRGNYRPETPVATTNTNPNPTTPTNNPPNNTSTKPNASVPAGPPLSKSEIVSMLHGGLTSARVEQFVEVRGVNFILTPDISKEISAAGGSRSLLGTISVNAKAVSNKPVENTASNTKPKSNEPDYDDLTDQAISEMQNNRAANAIRLLEQAVKIEPASPTAYQLMGFAQLYGYQNLSLAEQSMRSALERGGAATFRVYHDHDGFFKQYCQGTFFVTKAGVTFKADDGKHTFESFDTQIKESGLNDFFGSEYGAFHIKVFEDEKKKKTKTFNFAPATTKKEESKLVIALIQSY
jgi:hypothetical protein